MTSDLRIAIKLSKQYSNARQYNLSNHFALIAESQEGINKDGRCELQWIEWRNSNEACLDALLNELKIARGIASQGDPDGLLYFSIDRLERSVKDTGINVSDEIEEIKYLNINSRAKSWLNKTEEALRDNNQEKAELYFSFATGGSYETSTQTKNNIEDTRLVLEDKVYRNLFF